MPRRRVAPARSRSRLPSSKCAPASTPLSASRSTLVRAVVLGERRDAEAPRAGVLRGGLRLEVGRHVRAAEAVDRLLRVADDHERAAGLVEEQPLEDPPLDRVGVLELVDEPDLESRAGSRAARDSRRRRPRRRGEVVSRSAKVQHALEALPRREQLDGASSTARRCSTAGSLPSTPRRSARRRGPGGRGASFSDLVERRVADAGHLPQRRSPRRTRGRTARRRPPGGGGPRRAAGAAVRLERPRRRTRGWCRIIAVS